MIDYDGFGDLADVFVVDNNVIVADLTTEEIFSIAFNQIVIKRDNSNKNGSFNNEEKGVLTMHFDFTGSAPTGIAAQGSSQGSTGDYSFDVNGSYVWSASGGVIKNGDQKITTKLTADTFVGDGFDSSISPAIQSKVPGGNGEFLINDGSVDGSGKGTVTVEVD
jgi:2',3'-cyclic-nucleotide 2'-phosphodiesterase (5'-nucleotidase family)